MKTRSGPHKIGIISLGCAKNLVDSELLMKQLDASSFKIIPDPGEKIKIDTAIINTCGFILDAKNESVEMILRFIRTKQEGRIKFLFVMGCLSERYREQLAKELPEVDAFFGVHELGRIVERVGGKFRKELLGERMLATPSHYAYLKIAEGCDRRCSFCSIPLIRGKHISRPMAELVREAEFLASNGVKELIVISQDTTYYGLDLYKKRKLPDLLSKLAVVPGLEWIRLHYTYPDGFPMELLEVMKRHGNICKYIDIPLQHINTRVLSSMKRGVGKKETLDLVSSIRRQLPGAVIRTTLITGYPGETKKDFDELKEFVIRCRFDRLGVFTYSHEEGTGAFALKDNVPARVKQERMETLMQMQEGISLELNAARVGSTLKVLVEREETGYYVGRTEFDSPEIDNEVLIERRGKKLRTGHFYYTRITSADAFDLYGEIAD
ncbi:MAG: 30S ribosomal protein S12 methylthiotransferase RimO [Bacteroidetes bacterium]|nr:30S ribosomal protein S12 methylthiotransferase RimO [Bacteroidota bacterium]